MKKKKGKILSLALALVVASALLSPAAFAADGTPYVDENGVAHTTATPADTITSSDYVWGSDGLETWYAASGAVTINGSVLLKGDVNLILKDGCALSVKRGITSYAPQNVTFTVWGQSGGTGKLVVGSSVLGCGISADAVTFNGGGADASGYYVGVESDVLTVNGGSVSVKASFGDGFYGETVVFNGGDTVVEGHFNGINGDAVTIDGGKLDVKAYHGDGVYGEVVSVCGGDTTVSALDQAYNAVYGDVVSVTGGKLTVASVNEAGVYGETVSITGGEVKASSERDYAVFSYGSVVVSGGLYEGNERDVAGSSGKITGGVFKRDFTTGLNDPSLLAPGYVTRRVSLKNGVWTPDPDGDRWQVVRYAPETVASPEFHPNGGSFEGSQTVSVTCATEGATIYYTIDGGEPNPDVGLVYTKPFKLTASATVKAVATKNGANDSPIVEAKFVKKAAPPPSSGPKTPPSSGAKTPPDTDITNPKTGDGGNIALWTFLNVVSLSCAAFALFLVGKKRKDAE